MKLIIGDATLYLGDSYKLCEKIGPVDAMVTDPPYDFIATGGGKFRKNRKGMDQILKNGLNKGFDYKIFNSELYKSILTFCHEKQLTTLLPYLDERFKRQSLCFWRKTNPMPMANKSYRPELETYIHAWNKDGHPVGTVYEKLRVVESACGKSKYDHPTVKPDVVMNKIMKNVNGDTVIDPFMGTGSTGIAALKAGKKFIGIEKNPDFFRIACQRFFELYSVLDVS